MEHKDITHQVPKQPNTWILLTKFPRSHPLAILLTPWGFRKTFERERKILRRLHPSDAQSVLFREHGWSMRLQYSWEVVHFPHNPRSSLFRDKTMARPSLSSPSTSWIQPYHEPPNVGTRWGFTLSTTPRQSPYVLWLHWKLLNSETWQTSLISGRPSSTKISLVVPTTIPPRRKLSFYFEGGFEKKRFARESSYT